MIGVAAGRGEKRRVFLTDRFIFLGAVGLNLIQNDRAILGWLRMWSKLGQLKYFLGKLY